ncbi:MAG TPA: cytochrome c [Stellaceae bacterium]|jgi:mono/diheme cytochrome c family protein|nr:cytochrome c [Stellaceae bacterium]
MAAAGVAPLAAAAASPADPAAIARGRYLADAAGCDGCHTDSDHGGKSYAGGQVTTPFGMIATPNLTPDSATGIGRWSAADFARAVRWGIAPDDSHYVPTFPFPFYNRLSDTDLADIKAFLDSLPAVAHPDIKGASATALLARARAAIGVIAAPMPGAWRPDAGKDPVWNRGAYLVATVGRCGECHTPRSWLGAPDPERFLAGAPPIGDGKKAPNITPDRKAGIGNWSEDDIVTVLRDGKTPDFDEVGGSMAAIVKNTARLTDDDRHAIAVYLQSIPAVSIVSTAPSSGAASTAVPK